MNKMLSITPFFQPIVKTEIAPHQIAYMLCWEQTWHVWYDKGDHKYTTCEVLPNQFYLDIFEDDPNFFKVTSATGIESWFNIAMIQTIEKLPDMYNIRWINNWVSAFSYDDAIYRELEKTKWNKML
jgi:hypothetical protein